MGKRRKKLDSRNFCVIPEREELNQWGNGRCFKKMKQCKGINCTNLISIHEGKQYCKYCDKEVC